MVGHSEGYAFFQAVKMLETDAWTDSRMTIGSDFGRSFVRLVGTICIV